MMPIRPYWSWTRKVANKTVTRYLSDEQYERYRPSFDNARRAHELLAELEPVTLSVVETEVAKAKGRRTKPPAATAGKPARSERA